MKIDYFLINFKINDNTRIKIIEPISAGMIATPPHLSLIHIFSVLGMIHGGLFSMYVIMILVMALIVRIHIKWPVIAFIFAFISFGACIFGYFVVNCKSYAKITQ